MFLMFVVINRNVRNLKKILYLCKRIPIDRILTHSYSNRHSRLLYKVVDCLAVYWMAFCDFACMEAFHQEASFPHLHAVKVM